MDEATPKQLFLLSLDRCADDEQFIPAFYERFLATSDEIRHKFRHTDFEHQNQMLLRSLKLSAGATSGDPASLRELRTFTHNTTYQGDLGGPACAHPNSRPPLKTLPTAVIPVVEIRIPSTRTADTQHEKCSITSADAAVALCVARRAVFSR